MRVLYEGRAEAETLSPLPPEPLGPPCPSSPPEPEDRDSVVPPSLPPTPSPAPTARSASSPEPGPSWEVSVSRPASASPPTARPVASRARAHVALTAPGTALVLRRSDRFRRLRFPDLRRRVAVV